MGRLGRAFRRGMRRPLEQRLLFLHVAKCGGTSLRRALRDLHRHPLSGRRRHTFELKARESREVAEQLGRPVDELREELLRYHLCAGARFAAGHFAWPEGLREQFPDLCIVTLLRDPVSRFLSAYFAARAGSAPPAAARKSPSLEAFLDSEDAGCLAASFVRTFAGPTAADARSAEALALAKRHLASVDVLGVLEDLPSFAAAFERRFATRLQIPRANVGVLRRDREEHEVSAAVRERIRDLAGPDQQLYDFALGELALRARSSS